MRTRCRFLFALLACLVAAPALAQETREYDLPNLEEQVKRERSLKELVKVRFKASNRFVGMADFGSYRANSYQPEGRLKITVPVARNAGIRLMGTGRVLHYDFDEGSADLGIGTRSDGPFDDLYRWTVRMQGAYFLDEEFTIFSPRERWSLIADSFVQSRWEDGADVSEGINGGGGLAVGYRLGKTFEMAGGVSVRSRLRGGVGIRPLVEFDWKINDRWKLSSQGIGLQLERRFSERFTVFTRARWENNFFRLDQRGGDIGRPSLRIRQLPVGLGGWWNIGRHLRLTALGGVMAMHELRVKDRDGSEIDTDTADPSPYFLIRFDFR
ncbi:MAG: DUF6268 family outer membrane beta-barrel protein [Myxococcota bacterium]|nr:DUF6268 family outer membrane beta-barrel protein [Myxococcota bacterium]